MIVRPRALAFALLLFTIPATAAEPARQPTAADVKLANEISKTGLEKVKANDFEGARDAFTRAYALNPLPTTLANLAGAEAQTGRVVAAVAHYKQVLENPAGMPTEQVELLKSALRAAEARLAHIRISITGRKPSDRIELDGTNLTPSELDVDRVVDPGKHLVRVVRGSSEAAKAEVELRDGESKPVSLALRDPFVQAPPPPPPQEQEGGGVFRSPWFWIASGVIVVGATATTLCLAAFCKKDDPYSGTLGTVTLP